MHVHYGQSGHSWQGGYCGPIGRVAFASDLQVLPVTLRGIASDPKRVASDPQLGTVTRNEAGQGDGR